MENLLRSEIEKSVKLGEIECFTSDQIRNFTKESYEEINKSIDKEAREEMIEWVALEVKSFRPVEITDDNTLQKSVQFIRPSQIVWDFSEGDDIQKSRTGKYLDTELNRKLGRAGKRYEEVNNIEKSIDTDIEKGGKKAAIGEIREWGGVKYRKVSSTGNPNKDWQKVQEGGKSSDIEWNKDEDGIYTAVVGDTNFEIMRTHVSGEFVLTANGKGIVKGTLGVCKGAAKDYLDGKIGKKKEDITVENQKHELDRKAKDEENESKSKNLDLGIIANSINDLMYGSIKAGGKEMSESERRSAVQSLIDKLVKEGRSDLIVQAFTKK